LNFQKNKKMAGRTWRTAGFADLRDNNNDVEMPDARAGVSRLPHSSRHQREGIYGVTPRPPPSTPDARASGSIKGTVFTFGDPKEETAKPQYNLARSLKNQLAHDDERMGVEEAHTEREKTRLFLMRIGEGMWRKFDKKTGLPNKDLTRIQLRMSDLFSREDAFKRLKLLALNFLPWKDSSNQAYKNLRMPSDTIFSSRLNDIMRRILEHLESAGVELPQEDGLILVKGEKEASDMVENVVLLKEFFDLILNTETQLRASEPVKGELSVNDVADQEPPFFPILAEDEKNLVWAWIKAKEKALHVLYSDSVYVFAMKVAGKVNMSEFGVDKLISASHRQRITAAEFESMPPAHYDDPRISSERALLLDRYLQILNALQASKIEDLKEQQYSNNVAARTRALDGGKAPILWEEDQVANFVRRFQSLYGIFQEKFLPQSISDVASFETMNLSPKTRQLQFNLDTVESALKGVDMDNSRKRLLWAADWMQRPEVLKHGDLTPLFLGALDSALFAVHQFAPKLHDVVSYDAFINSDSFDVTSAFAELVALQILRSKFYAPTKTQLDKMGQRIDARSQGLLRIFKNFIFDASSEKVKDLRSASLGSSCFAATMYAF
jgi:hypothetical protein